MADFTHEGKKMTKTILCDSLPRAAFYIASGIEPLRSEHFENGRFAWEFEPSERLEKLTAEYRQSMGGAGLIVRFMNARRRLLNEAARER